jgi:hypothetical protein
MWKSAQRQGSFEKADLRVLRERAVFFFKSVMGWGTIYSEYNQR